MTKTALELLETAIADLECRLGLKPGEDTPALTAATAKLTKEPNNAPKKSDKKKKAPADKKQKGKTDSTPPADDQPVMCKLQFKVGVITKVWNHPEADKLYCEEIDCGEETPRQIASGLRPHFTLAQMEGQRLLVVSNLKAKNLVRFKSHGMVLCAATKKLDENGNPTEEEIVEFVEPPADAPIGEVISFEGLPTPQPVAPSQVEKKKVFQACMPGMKTTEDCVAVWKAPDGTEHAFTTSAGPCRSKTVKNGDLR
eukprot:CAMPEP_0113463714 /NCGR_PEP_ID=MMETSP0014_2-20120614/12807_1 /TAXON_ID=2857 /ORGANISM="Nitzschia sp." /LENGTH=254 /DNA_ID=CAMNT_0000355731 /DNA_START=25 /DNA_END=789 /DNA_ORIENTATION=+ /assembly_acc=CAM_ASM_000159